MLSKTSMVLIIAAVCLSVIVTAAPLEFEMDGRPIRPRYFNSDVEVNNYIARLMEYIKQRGTGGRFGKRSPQDLTQIMPQYFGRPNQIY